MKKHIFLIFAALFLIGCGNEPQKTAITANVNQTIQNQNNLPIVSSRSESLENVNPQPSNKTASTESPMAKPVDVSELTAAIEKARKNPEAKGELAKAYFARATVLTGAAQYRAALGDYRKGLKLDPNDEDAKAMHDKIISIFKSINREPPKEGEEPAPLALK